jgi:hypothetical protein
MIAMQRHILFKIATILLGAMSSEEEGQGAEEPKSPRARGDVPPRAMWYRISAEPGYLKAELYGRQTVEETREFLDAVAAEAPRHGRVQLLISVRNSAAIFTVERYGLSHYLDIAFESARKIALMGDSLELRVSHQYIATLARMRGVNLRAFLDESAAIQWLLSDETPSQVPETS